MVERRTLSVSPLSGTVTREVLHEVFQPYGHLTVTMQDDGHALLVYESPAAARLAKQAMHNQPLHAAALKLQWADDSAPDTSTLSEQLAHLHSMVKLLGTEVQIIRAGLDMKKKPSSTLLLKRGRR
eukprot:NODE_6888_length_490_cov_39.650138_g6722_i0.p1 GENE.NODE_6888_length_490_cov_39.650138_g6722_i0~~NODE_6888_length_490_cov_39.650138_g6722_i0.p1  ORF type:complete len:126 (-),score=24.81 NODE_6888_length_490_cov_39.650138_g6722_i0:93-470(-)